MAYKGKDGKLYVNKPVDYHDSTDSGADKAFLSKESQEKIQGFKDAWAKAQAAGDQAGMDAAHAAAEAIREQAGYQGGANGGAYNVLAKEAEEAVGGGSGSRGSGGGSSAASRRFSYESAPTYASKYQAQIDDLTKQILGRAAFEYDPEKDPTYQQYKDSYTRSGERAMQDTLGQVSARTGGLASSYAGAAAQQTYDGYMAALADKIPELKQLAYQMYQDEGATQRANLEMLMALEQGDYAKYQTLLSQYNADRSFDYGVFSDDRALDYQVGRDAVADSQWQQTFDRGVLESDRAFGYQQGRDQIADQRYDQEYADSRADVEWQRLNYKSEQEYERALTKAQTLAAAGDFSGFKAMGYSDSEVSNLKKAYDKAQAAVASGASKSSGSRSSGSGSTSKKQSGGDTETTGILAAMYALGNDAAAYEYLVGLDLAAGKTDTLWNLYQSGGKTESRNYSTVRATAAGYKDIQDAKAYLERMVDGGYITPDEAASIYQVDLGGVAQAAQSVPTTYSEFAAVTGNPNIMTELEFARARNSKRTEGYSSYQDYLAKMYEKYKK